MFLLPHTKTAVDFKNFSYSSATIIPRYISHLVRMQTYVVNYKFY